MFKFSGHIPLAHVYFFRNIIKLYFSIKIVHADTDTKLKGKEQLEWFKEMLLEKVQDDTISFHSIAAKTIVQCLRMSIGDEKPNLIAYWNMTNAHFFLNIP
ncbi:hypothetical protein [Maribacter cobaltidurans]|uniref:Uncharacterized protein n=1 Tax=Maribacter cobaltidurans TaxID=1178778 RepID=A0A223V5R9_9FLAO|nr:hypothetical protein [Maribacter cobaltidurans]ASV30743.1 hypothetical protein CJ263_11230 [Maribacter cobaltidurans]GGD81421.1 hypothetical protein GCM10011412_18920 [Maribacter cobaltidurans]